MRRTALRTAILTVATFAAASLVPLTASAAPLAATAAPESLAAAVGTDAPAVEVDGAELVSSTTARDGSVTLTYDNGDWITMGPVETSSVFTLEDGVFARSSQQSRDWTASYSAGLNSEYFHHDGGTIKNVVSFSSCGITQKMYLMVATSLGGYTRSGSDKNIPCSGAAPTWTSPEGNKKWRIYDPNTSDQYFPNRASGTIYWQD